MADLVVGMSKMVVLGAVTKFRLAIEEEAKHREKARRDLVSISLEFEMMRTFLDMVDEQSASGVVKNNNLVATWVRHVRELAYDLEDCVEFIVHLDSGRSSLWLRLLPSCIAPPLPLDQAVMELEQLKGRVQDVNSCYTRYSSITVDSAGGSNPIGGVGGATATPATAYNMLAEATRDSAGGAKMQQCLGDLTQLITKTEDDLQLQVISVCGDLGLTPIIWKAYNDQEILKSFVCRAWVKLMHPFNPHEFVRRFMAHVYANAGENQGTELGVETLTNMEPPQGDLLKENFMQHVNNKRYLIVLEGLSGMEDWDPIRSFLPDMKNGSRIIVSTGQPEIASLCVGHPYELKRFLTDHSDVCVLFKEVHMQNPLFYLNERKQVQLEEIISKCGGVPEVIISIANLLASENHVTWMDLNRRFIHYLETNPKFDSLRDLFGSMHSYFQACPDSLKPCIFYLSIFPRDHVIRRRRLIRRWIAECYSRDSDQSSAEESGETFFSNLLDRGIIQRQLPELDGTDALHARCQVNGFIREYIISRRMEENLLVELDGYPIQTIQRTGRHLVISRSWDRDRIVFKSIDFSRLRSLTVFGKWESFFISRSMKILRVLDLEDSSGVTDGDLEKIVKHLRRLKFLSLRGCSEICHLPSSLGDLRHLQTLDVRNTSIVTLPDNINKLKKLQYVRAGITAPAPTLPVSSSWLPGFCIHHRRPRRQIAGVKVPGGIGSLTALHTLGVVNVAASVGKAVLEDLKKLIQLRKLGVSGINMNNSKELFSSISAHCHLESLSVQLDTDNQSCLDDISLPWENLQSLKLYGLQDKLPKWSDLWSQNGSIDHLRKLEKLDLEMATLIQDDIDFLGKLPQLCILRVKQVQAGELHFCVLTDKEEAEREETDSFPKVKVLQIACGSSSGTLHVTFGSKSMKQLELLRIDCSSGSSYQLTGLNYLSELKQVQLKGTNDEALKTNLENQFRSHPNKPAVKLEELVRSS